MSYDKDICPDSWKAASEHLVSKKSPKTDRTLELESNITSFSHQQSNEVDHQIEHFKIFWD